MVGSVEDRIVSIKFDNQEFEQKIAATSNSLDTLSQKINNLSAGKGFSDINASANNVNLAPIAAGVDNISSKFDALHAVAFSALQSITQGALGFAKNFVNTDILEPLITGGKTRAQNLDQAKFAFAGLGMNVDAVMANAKQAVLGTAYGLGDAAAAAAQFGASGISVGNDMVQSLQAIAGTAAMTGRSYGEMAQIFTSSAASGKVTNMDLLQFSTRGLNAAAAYAKQNGITEASVHEMATKGTLDYASFAKAMDAAFGAHSTMANQTYSGSLDNLHAAMSRLSAAYFTPEMLQQRDVFNAMTPQVDNLAKAMQPLIDAFLKVRGTLSTGLIGSLNKLDMTPLTEAFTSFGVVVTNVFKSIEQIIGAFKAGFKEIFPGSAILSITLFADKIALLSESLKMGAETSEKVKSIFAGFFAIVSIGIAVLKGIVSVVENVVHALSPAGSSFLTVGAGLGDFLVKAKELLVDGGAIQKFFNILSDVIVKPIEFIQKLTIAIVGFFAGIAHVGSDQISGRFTQIGDAAKGAESIWDKLLEKLQGVARALDAVWQVISNWFHELADKIKSEIQPSDFNGIVDLINVGLLGAIVSMLQKFFAGGVKFGLQGGLFTTISNNIKQVNNSLKLMQTDLKAEALMKIGAAIALITVSIIALSLVNSAALTKALAAMAVGFTELGATMMMLNKSTDSIGGAGKIGIISTALIALSIAMDIFSVAIKRLGTMSSGDLAKGMGAIAIGLTLMIGAVNLMPDQERMIAAGVAMDAMAIAMAIMAGAVKLFGSMSFETIAKGLGGIAVGLAAVVIAMNFMPPGGVLSGLAFVAISVGLIALSEAVKRFGALSWGDMAKGLLGLTVALTAITVAMNFMPVTLPITAAGLILVAIALGIMAEAIKSMGQNSIGTLAKGIGALAIVLAILVAAMSSMEVTLPGAAAMVVVAGALYILAQVMEQLGKLSLKELGMALLGIAGAFIELGVAALLLGPVLPAMLGLGVALALVGAGFALFGGAVLGIALGLQILAVSGVAGITAFVASLGILMKAMPQLAAAAALFVVHFVDNLLQAAPVLIKLITALLEQILETVIKLVPLIVKALGVIIDGFVKLAHTKGPELIEVGLFLFVKLLEGLSKNAEHIAELAATILSKFIQGLANKMPEIVGAAVNLVVAFINGISKNADKLVAAGTNLIVSFIEGLSNAIVLIVNAVGNLIIAFITAVGNKASDIVTAGVNTVLAFLSGLANNALALANGAAQVLVQFLNGLADAINTYAPQIRAAGQRVGSAIINGVVPGFSSAWSSVSSWLGDMGKKVSDACMGAINWLWDIGRKIITGLWNGMKAIWNDVTNWLGGLGDIIKSVKGPPAKDAIMLVGNGMLIMQGLHNGMKAGWAGIQTWLSSLNAADSFGNKTTDAINKTISTIPEAIAKLDEFHPKITPVLDVTKIKQGAADLAKHLGTGSISATVSTSQAGVISTTTTAPKSGSTSGSSGTCPPSSVTFIQNNNAPKQLSTNDIYRQTRSQIVLAKEELGIK